MVTVIQEAQHRRHVVQGFVLPPRYYGVAVVQYVRDSGLEHLGDRLESRPFYEGPARRDAQPCPFVESDDRGGAVLVELSDALGPRLCTEVLDRRVGEVRVDLERHELQCSEGASVDDRHVVCCADRQASDVGASRRADV